MAIQQGEVSLIARSISNIFVTEENFLAPLKAESGLTEGTVTSFGARATPMGSGYITLVSEDVIDYIGKEYPDSYISKLFSDRLHDVAKWLNSFKDEIREMSLSFEIYLYIELTIHSGQLDLIIPVELIAACHDNNIPIKMLTNT